MAIACGFPLRRCRCRGRGRAAPRLARRRRLGDLRLRHRLGSATPRRWPRTFRRPAARSIAATARRTLGSPQRDTAEQAVHIRYQAYIGRQLELDRLGVAAADVEMIEIDHRPQDVDDPRHPLVPLLLADLFQSGTADILVIGQVALDRVMRELQMRHDPAVVEKRSAGAGAEGQHEFDALALDRAEALHVGIVHDAHRLAPALGKLVLQIEAGEHLGTEIGRRQYPAFAHRTGKADRCPIKFAEHSDRFVDGCS